MIIDSFGQQVYTEQDLCNLYLTNPDIELKNVLVAEHIKFDIRLDLVKVPALKQYDVNDLDLTIEEFDQRARNTWFIPDEYRDFDIAKYVLDQCTNETELQRAGEELLLYQERDMFMLLRYLKYLVDTMRQNNIVWGVGRGSSVSSFVLYLIGVHRINSLYYDLSVDEFFK